MFMKSSQRHRLVSSLSESRFACQKGVTLLEALIVLAIIALLAVFVTQCTPAGNLFNTLSGSATVSAARETINVAAKNFMIAAAPVIDCSKAAALTADVTAAQTKINDAARDYAADYAANKAAIQIEVDKVNQQITLYNSTCSSAIPLITLPP